MTGKPKQPGKTTKNKRWAGREPMEMLRVKGVHFDKGGKKSSLVELMELDGLFEFKDIHDRLPQPKRRIERWIVDGNSFVNVFYRLPISPEQNTTYIDLKEFMRQLRDRMEGFPDRFSEES